jgi:hypothetical protein
MAGIKSSRSRTQVPKKRYSKETGEELVRVMIVEGKRTFRWQGKETGTFFSTGATVKR